MSSPYILWTRDCKDRSTSSYLTLSTDHPEKHLLQETFDKIFQQHEIPSLWLSSQNQLARLVSRTSQQIRRTAELVAAAAVGALWTLLVMIWKRAQAHKQEVRMSLLIWFETSPIIALIWAFLTRSVQGTGSFRSVLSVCMFIWRAMISTGEHQYICWPLALSRKSAFAEEGHLPRHRKLIASIHLLLLITGRVLYLLE